MDTDESVTISVMVDGLAPATAGQLREEMQLTFSWTEFEHWAEELGPAEAVRALVQKLLLETAGYLASKIVPALAQGGGAAGPACGRQH
jgi:hypothetical protein